MIATALRRDLLAGRNLPAELSWRHQQLPAAEAETGGRGGRMDDDNITS